MGSMMKGKIFVENLMRENSLKGLFGLKKDELTWEEEEAEAEKEEEQISATEGAGISSFGRSTKWVREFSSSAKVVAARCAKILLSSIVELQQQFDDEVPESAKTSAKYSQNMLEYFCFRALAVATGVTDYLSSKDFRRLTFEMMRAWENLGASHKPAIKVDTERTVGKEAFVRLGPAIAGIADPVTVDTERTVGKEAFVRLGPAIAGIADPVTVHIQFDALAAATEGRLPFSVYEKYLGELEKALKAMKSQSSSAHLLKLEMVKGENVVEIDGTVTTQPVLQHIGVSTWPGRLTLTDHALYFESIGVVSYDKAKRFDLAGNSRQTIKPDLSGPWGARLFDKSISCKSTAIPEPLVFEFPEFTGHARRDYWLAIVREIICTHQFIRKYQLDEAGKSEALSRAILGIARLRAIRDLNHALPSKPEALLTFLTGEELPGGDLIMEAMAQTFESGDTSSSSATNGNFVKHRLSAISAAGFGPSKKLSGSEDAAFPVGEFLIGDLNPVEKAVMHSRDNSKRVELAQSSIEGVKVDGIEVNMAVMKELMVPLSALLEWIESLQSWDEPFKTSAFLIVCSYIVVKNLLAYVIPVCLLWLAGFMLWLRNGHGGNSGEIKVISPATQNAVEQLLALQQGITELKDLLQAGNIVLLKLRAILFSALPQATDQVVKGLVILAFCLAFLPIKLMLLLVLWEVFTRQTYFRRESTERIMRRMREFWYSIPVVPIRLVKVEDEKKIK